MFLQADGAGWKSETVFLQADGVGRGLETVFQQKDSVAGRELERQCSCRKTVLLVGS